MRLLLLALLLTLAGCASVTPPPPPPIAPAIVQAQSLAARHAGLSGAAQRANAAAITQLLGSLDDATLTRDAARLSADDPLYAFVAHALRQRGLPLPHPLPQQAFHFGAPGRPPADADGYRPPLQVAVLLPLTGPQAAVAAAVRDGYLTGYYQESRRRPRLRFYDTTPGVAAALAHAAADGNDAAVGPLLREDVATALADTPPLPLLALNRSDDALPAGSAAFSLSPEDEGASLAQALIERGSHHVLLIAGNEDAQQRTATAAETQLRQRGVRVTRLPATSFLASALTALTPAPDAVLLVTKGAQARSVVPQLGLAGLGGVPRYASSQITLGTGKAAEDAALDGTLFPTEPWLVARVNGLPTQTAAAARVDTAKGVAARLFAFGLDAWRLTGYLEYLAQHPQASLPGATGRLRLDETGNVVRQPAWSQFRAGRPQPLTDGER